MVLRAGLPSLLRCFLNKQDDIDFQSDLATTLFGIPPSPARAAEEAALTERALSLCTRATSKELIKKAPEIDALILSRLTGFNRLKVLRVFEQRASGGIPRMSIAKAMQEHLRNAHELSDVLSPGAIHRLCLGLEELQAKEKQQKEDMAKRYFAGTSIDPEATNANELMDNEDDAADYEEQDGAVYSSRTGQTLPSMPAAVAVSLVNMATSPSEDSEEEDVAQIPAAVAQAAQQRMPSTGGWNPAAKFAQQLAQQGGNLGSGNSGANAGGTSGSGVQNHH